MTVFVGRERELAQLRAGLAAALAGDGAVFLLTGEAGIGKTTLVSEFGREAVQRGARLLHGGNFEAGGAPPFWPWIQVLRACRAETATNRAAECTDALRLPVELRQLLPEVAWREGLEPELARFHLFDAVGGVLQAQCAIQPLVIFLDDLQWTDETSLLLLQFLARDRAGAQMVVIGAYRELEAQRRPEIARQLAALACDATTVALGGLDQVGVAAMIRQASARPYSDTIAAAVYEATGGNPLFVDEMVRSLVADGRLDESSTAARLPLPERVRAVVRRRMSHLSDGCRRALATAAVIGRDFDLVTVSQACGEQSQSALAAIDEARAAQIIRDADGRFTFAHDLFQEVLYDDLSSDERRRLHGLVGEVLERLYAGNVELHLAQLAHHFCRAAAESDKAIQYCVRAAQRAAAQLGFEEAARHCQMALTALSGAATPDPVRRCQILLLLGETSWKMGEINRARQIYAETADLADGLGLAEVHARAALGFGGHDISFDRANLEPRLVQLLERALVAIGPQDGPLRAALMARLGTALTFSDHTRGESLAREAVAMARRLADPDTLHFVLCCFVCAAWGPDNLEERIAVGSEIARLSVGSGAAGIDEIDVSPVAQFDEAGDAAGAERETEAYRQRTQLARQHIKTWILTVRDAMVALVRGRYDEAESLGMQALQLGDASQNPNAAQYFGAQLIPLRREQGRLTEVVDGVAAFAADSPELPIWRAALAWIYAELDRPVDAQREVDRVGAAGFSAIPRDMYWLPCLWLLAEVVAKLGDRRRADVLYELLYPYRDRCAVVPMTFNAGSLERSLGLLATVVERYADAADHFEAAARVHERIGSRPWLAHGQHEYARLLVARGRMADRERALDLLRRAVATARELGMTALLARAEPLLAELVPASHDEALFRREGEYWSVGYDGRTTRVRDARGLRLISLLLCVPGRDIPAAQLAAWPEAPVGPGINGRDLARELGLGAPSLDDCADPDARARAEYRARLEALRDEAEEADRFNDPWRAGRAREEMAAIAEYLGPCGSGARLRKDSERARLAVTKAIRYAIQKVERAHPRLGRILATTVKTGTYCRYEPDRERPIRWTF